MKRALCVFVLISACGSGDPPPDAYPWNVAEEPVPTEVWFDTDSSLGNGFPPFADGHTCQFPVGFRVSSRGMRPWISVGGPFATPTRTWFQCERSVNFYKLDEGQFVVCGYDGMTLYVRDERTLTHLPAWLESAIDWRKAEEEHGGRTDGLSAILPTVGYVSLFIRVFDPDSGRITEYRESFPVLAIQAWASVQSDHPTGPVRLGCLSGHHYGQVDLTQRCGSDTNCPTIDGEFYP